LKIFQQKRNIKESAIHMYLHNDQNFQINT
jgi:hypothetical protein